MKYLMFYLVFLSCFIVAQNVEFSDFDRYQDHFTQQQISQKIQKYLQKHPQLQEHYSLTSNTFELFASLQQKQQGKPEYILQLIAESKKTSTKKLSLKNLKVAIDPGHLGGPLFSYLESRYIDMVPKNIGNKEVRFNEGQNALLTALHLRDLLVKQGAIVMITHEKLGEAVYHKDFFTWLKEDFLAAVEEKTQGNPAERCRWLSRAPLHEIFRRFYNPLDLKARANKINEFAPDISIIIHYNVATGNDENGQNIGSDKNYCMTFVPGSFMQGELKTPRQRYEFMRLLLSNDLPNSVALSHFVTQEFVKLLNIPTVKDTTEGAEYLERSCMKTEYPGVYARNLTLTGLVHGAICYGESQCQDNYQECLALAQKDIEIHGMATSKRIQLVAEAYYNGIVAYVENSK